MSDDVARTDAAPPSEPAPSQPPALEPASQPPAPSAVPEAPVAAAAPPAAPAASVAPASAPAAPASSSAPPAAAASSTPRKIPKKAPEKGVEKRKAVDPPKAAAAPPAKRIAENNRDKPNGSSAAAAADDSDDDEVPLFKKPAASKPEPKPASSPRKETKEPASSSHENGDKGDTPKPKEKEKEKEEKKESSSKSSSSKKAEQPVKKGQAVVVTKKKEKKSKAVYEEVAGDDDLLEEAERKLEGKERKKKRKRKSSDDEAFDDEEEPEEEEEEEEEDSDYEEKKKKKHKKDKKKDKEKKKHKKDKKKHKKDKKKDKEKSSKRRKSSSTNAGMSRQVVNDASKYQEMEEIVPLQATKGANKWWDRTDRDANIKWETLVHNGVLFPPAYEPHGIKMLYEGKEVELTPEEEEVATMYAGMLETDFVKNKVFNKNFFADWSKILGKGHVIQRLDKCDFTPIHAHLVKVREEKKEQRKDSKYKKEQKEEKERLQAIYGTAIVDGYKEKVGNYRVEPPGLFRGRGQHPKSGFLKRRVQPEDVIINIGKGVPIPKCPIPGHHWKGVIHNQEVTWLAYWKDNINKDFKYVFLAANSRFKGESDLKKYEKARTLKSHIDQIRKDYTMGLASKDLASRQLAVTMYLIDKLALRVGNEKDTKEEADTVGCCSLRVEHLTLTPPNRILFDFLGKDSMRYLNEVEVDTRVYNNIQEFIADKKPGTDVFDKITPTILNQHLSSLMTGLTAKVFRTYNASVTLQQELFETKSPAEPDQIIGEKVLFYNRANREVAILCNHQRTVPKGYETQMTKLDETLKDLNLRLQILEDHLEDIKGGKKKGKKDKAKLEPEYQEFADKLPNDSASIQKRITTMKTRIANNETKKQLKNDTKTVALGTSKINYMDPRITVAWCKATETPIEKIFNKSLMSKFPWAMEVSMEWRF